MIILSYSNIDIIQGVIRYGNASEGITDWRISNTSNGNVGTSGIFNIFNSSSVTANLSIIDNGNVGIGTTPATSSSKLEIIGDINISGNYKKNNRDIINETSNYVVTTSNILVPFIITNVGNSSNYVSRINSELNTRINNTSNYVLTTSNFFANRVSNNSQYNSIYSGIYYNTIPTQSLPNELGVEKYMVFTYTGDTIPGSGQTQYTINVPTGGIGCDILVVGGGGSGGNDRGGGGGGGGVIYTQNITLNGSFTISVGNGGIGNTSGTTGGSGTRGTNGINSSISGSSLTTITAIGGGTGGSCNPSVKNGLDGGSGGGGSQYGGAGSGGNGTTGQGNSGGTGYEGGAAAGGGGATAIGTNATSTNAGNGGIGRTISISGTSVIYGSGGGGGGSFGSGIGGYNQVFGTGGSSGAGNGANVNANGANATIYGCGGGGGGLANTIVTKGGNGAPGVVIIKYYTIQQTIQKSISSSPVITPNVITGITSGTIGTTDRYISYTYTSDSSGLTGQTQYILNINENLICDILIVGGGGGGDRENGSGGGGGAVLYATNVSIPANTYTIKVGNGGLPNVNGSSSEAFGAICLGGGSTSYVVWPGANNGTSGGSGSGGSSGSSVTGIGGSIGTSTNGNILSSSTLYNGNIGGNGFAQFNGGTFPVCSGGGGGAGTPGITSTLVDYTTRSNWISAGKPGSGGDGVAINITGTSYYWGAGGGGGSYNTHSGDGGLGGGGGGGAANRPAGLAGTGGINTGVDGIRTDTASGGGGGNGATNTGSGGGGGSYYGSGGNGGSGIVIIRYRYPTTTTANIGIGTTNPTSEIHVYNDTTNNTILTIENKYSDTIVISPNTIGYTAVETLESNKYYRTLTFNYFPNYPENSPNTSLLAWYRFDSDGLDYNPYPTKYNLIANVGTPTYSTGTTADSFFQGRRYINTSSGSLKTTALALASRSFSVSVWMRTKNSASFSSIGPFTSLINQGNTLANTSIYLGYYANNAYGLVFISNDLSCGTGVSGNPTSYPGDLNNWVHIVYVVLSNFNRRIYRNGILIATDANTTASTATGDIRFGADYNNNNVSINTDISDVRIYDNGLSAIEVATLFASYTNLVITDDYYVNFKNSTTLLVNGVSKTVSGTYNISMGNINSSMLPAGGQSDIPLASTAITALPIKYEYSITSPSLPTLITVAGATSYIIGTTERCISFPYTTDSSGLTGQTQYTFTPTEDLWCDILIVGGGGGGGRFGGGGGAGHVLFGTNLKLNSGISVSFKVGNGGAGATTNINGLNGYNSSIIINSSNIYIANGGGGGGSRGTNNGIGSTGNNGGSGGGGSPSYAQINQGFGGICDNNIYSNFQSFGNNGGIGRPNQSGTSEPYLSSGGGGGAGSVGSNYSDTTGGGNGGLGKEFISYFGTNVGHNGYFGGGGGGQTWYGAGNRGYGNGGLGLYGGGGNGGFDGILEYSAENGMSNTGGGGGGGKGDGTTSGSVNGGNGGSGFVIIRYRKNNSKSSSVELISNTIIQKSEGLPDEIIVAGTTSMVISETLDRYILFTYTTTTAGLTGQTQYTFTLTETLNCDILVIGGGGGGGANGGGGGGGSGYVYFLNITLAPKAYTVRVGAGGAGPYGGNTNGYNSSFSANDSSISYTSLGGGKGGSRNGGGAYYSTQGGCGGGGGGLSSSYGVAQAGIQSSTYGYGIGLNSASGYDNGYASSGGGGGGAGSAGTNGAPYNAGIGGDGISNNITGTPIIYCAGGGGGPSSWSGTQGKSGSNNQGSYGSGSYGGQEGQGAPSGKNGVVIIRYRKVTNTTRTINKNNYKIGNYNGDFKIISSNYLNSITSTEADYMRITRDGSSIYNPTGSPLWSTISDKRIKENIEKASYDKCFESINKLELYRFNYIKELKNINKDKKQLGYIAQDVQDIFPKAVSIQEFRNDILSIPDMLSIDITQINYSLYGAIKKLIEMYNDIDKQISIIEKILNIDNKIVNVEIDTLMTSNLILENTLMTSNITLEDTFMSSNITFEDTFMTSNITLEDTFMSSNITFEDTFMTSNITLEDSLMSSNITLEDSLMSSNITLEDTLMSSNITLEDSLMTSNMILEDTLMSSNQKII